MRHSDRIPVKSLRSDARVDQRLLRALERVGLAEPARGNILDSSTPIEAFRGLLAEMERGMRSFFEHIWSDLPRVDSFIEERQVIGTDGNSIELMIHRPNESSASTPLPCLYYMHGGGMCMLSARDEHYKRLCSEIAAQSRCMVVSVDFRNSAGSNGPHPFPAGLRDCFCGLEWLHEHREELGISKIIACGESGGGNLALALPLLAKKEGKMHLLQGVYACCPMISNLYDEESINSAHFRELPSLADNNGLSFHVNGLYTVARAYDPDRSNARNPLAWPYWAASGELRGLPPHVISINELDPLASEGAAYYRKLSAAGVRSRCRVQLGTTHSSDLLLIHHTRDLFLATVADMKSFADSV